MLSDTAVAILAFLRTIPDSAACEECVALYLGIERPAALVGIRELVDASKILGTYRACGLCRRRRLVAQVWRPSVHGVMPHRSGPDSESD